MGGVSPRNHWVTASHTNSSFNFYLGNPSNLSSFWSAKDMFFFIQYVPKLGKRSTNWAESPLIFRWEGLWLNVPFFKHHTRSQVDFSTHHEKKNVKGVMFKTPQKREGVWASPHNSTSLFPFCKPTLKFKVWPPHTLQQQGIWSRLKRMVKISWEIKHHLVNKLSPWGLGGLLFLP